MSLELSTSLIGFLAGLVVALSNLPDFIGSLKKPTIAPLYRVARDSLACAGNLLWVLYGIKVGAVPIVVFCTLASVMLLTLVSVQLRLRLRTDDTFPPNVTEGESS